MTRMSLSQHQILALLAVLSYAKSNLDDLNEAMRDDDGYDIIRVDRGDLEAKYIPLLHEQQLAELEEILDDRVE